MYQAGLLSFFSWTSSLKHICETGLSIRKNDDNAVCFYTVTSPGI